MNEFTERMQKLTGAKWTDVDDPVFDEKEKPMTDNELNALVAKHVMDAYNVRKFSGEWTQVEPGLYQLPDYANDIAAAWQVELRIKELGTQNLYVAALSQIVAPEYASIFTSAIELDPWAMELDGHTYLWLMVTATAKQRCLAALKAVGVEVGVFAVAVDATGDLYGGGG